MLIAIDARYFYEGELNAYKTFTREIFLTLATQQSSHQFLFILDKHFAAENNFAANVMQIVITPKPKNYLTYKWWYHVRLPLMLKRNKADVFIGSYGLLSGKTNARQILLLHDLSFLHKNANHTRHSVLFYKKNTADNLKLSSAIVVVSDSIKNELSKAYSVKADKAIVCNSGVSYEYKPIEWNKKEEVKQEYSGGCEYFLLPYDKQTASQFITVLKAFSIFKKWQRSNLKLIVIADSLNLLQDQLQKLETYKHKNDIILLEQLSLQQDATLKAAAYAFIHPVLYEGFSYNVLQAMKCGTPTIAFDNDVVKEIAGEAAFYATPSDAASLAEQMKVIYKNENLRNQLVEKSLEKSKLFEWDNTRSIIWDVIEQVNQTN